MVDFIQEIAGLKTFHDKVKAECEAEGITDEKEIEAEQHSAQVNLDDLEGYQNQLEDLINRARALLADLAIPEGMQPIMPSLNYVVTGSPYYYKNVEFADRSGEAMFIRGYTCRNDSFFFVEEREAKRMLSMIRVDNEDNLNPDPEGEWGYSDDYPDLDCVEFTELELPGKTLKGYTWTSPRANGFLL